MTKSLFTIGLFACILAGCTVFEEPLSVVQESESVVTLAQTRAGTTPVFETMENPYDLARMRRLTGNSSLQRTHIYGRFLPQDSTQLNLLEDVLELDLFDYPLDINIEDDEIYIDPTIPEGEFTWQYTVVPANFVFPTGITWEKLEDAYIPAEDEVVPPATRTDILYLEEAAIRDCGYSIPPETRASGRPAGKVTVLDNSVTPNRYVPVKGVKVKCHYFLKVDNDYTDVNGNYSIGKKFHVKPKYTVVFKNEKDFIIWDEIGVWCRAKYQVKDRQSPSGYDIAIEPDLEGKIVLGVGIGGAKVIYNLGWQAAVINNAAYDYYRMCETTGITKPPKDLKILVHTSMGNSAPMLRRMSAIQVLTKDNWATFIGAQTGLTILANMIDRLFKFLEPDLTINAELNNKNYRSFYETTNHELSHASHFSKVGSSYWSKYVSYIVQNNGYGDGHGSYKGNCEVGEMWGYAMGHVQESEQFDKDSWDVSYLINFNRPYQGEWIHPDPIWALITRGVLTKRQVFDSMTADVDTVDKWIAKLCSMYPTQAEAIETAFAVNDVPTITGPDKPAINTSAAYSVPAAANMPADVEFTGWTVAPASGFTVTGGLASRTLNIRFTAEGNYTLTANFTLPDGTAYAATKTVSITVPLAKPVVTGKAGLHYVFTVTSPAAGATYQWELNGKPVDARVYLPELIVNSQGAVFIPLQEPINRLVAPIIRPLSFTARCRATRNGATSAWSETVTLFSAIILPPPGGGGGTGGGGSTILNTPNVVGSAFSSGGRFTVTNPTQGATYQWELDGKTVTGANANGPVLNVSSGGGPIVITPHASKIVTARCRARKNGVTTAWCNPVAIRVQ